MGIRMKSIKNLWWRLDFFFMSVITLRRKFLQRIIYSLHMMFLMESHYCLQHNTLWNKGNVRRPSHRSMGRSVNCIESDQQQIFYSTLKTFYWIPYVQYFFMQSSLSSLTSISFTNQAIDFAFHPDNKTKSLIH